MSKVYEVALKDSATETVTADSYGPQNLSAYGFVEFVLNGEPVYAISAIRIVSIKLVTPKGPQPETDIRRVLDALFEVVAEFGPDYVYHRPDGQNCLYVHNGAPHCLAGKVLRKLGVPLAQLSAKEGSGCSRFTNVGLNVNALSVLQTAQEAQDRGKTWGYALRQAVDYAAEYDVNVEIPNYLEVRSENEDNENEVPEFEQNEHSNPTF